MTKTAPAGHYPMIIEWSDQDGTYLVTVPDLPGCMADGPTPNEAAREAETAIALWLEMATEMGRTIPRPTHRLVQA